MQALDSIDPELGAFISVDPDWSLRAARDAPEGRLHGLTVAVKDLIDVGGLRSTYGSPRFIEHIAQRSAPAVSALTEQGAVIVGKANLNEFAFGVTGFNPTFGAMRCPNDDARTPGGSSGGSAVAVAAGNCDLAVGTDTSGSSRIPAACVGVWGFKCAQGADLSGVWPLAASFDSLGYLARSPAVLERVLGLDAPTEVPFDLSRVRVGRVGHDLELPSLPQEHWVRFRHEAWAVHGQAFRADPGSYGEDLQVKLAKPLGDLVAADKAMFEWRREFVASQQPFDLLVDTVFDGPAPLLTAVLDDYKNGTFIESDRLLEKTPVANVLGWPGLVFPTADGPRHIMGRPGTERAMFEVARSLSAT